MRCSLRGVGPGAVGVEEESGMTGRRGGGVWSSGRRRIGPASGSMERVGEDDGEGGGAGDEDREDERGGDSEAVHQELRTRCGGDTMCHIPWAAINSSRCID